MPTIHVDPEDKSLTPSEAEELRLMLARRDKLRADGRYHAARGAESIILIRWRSLKADFQDTQPTNFGEIDD